MGRGQDAMLPDARWADAKRQTLTLEGWNETPAETRTNRRDAGGRWRPQPGADATCNRAGMKGDRGFGGASVARGLNMVSPPCDSHRTPLPMAAARSSGHVLRLCVVL
jgi:hypothetical protein